MSVLILSMALFVYVIAVDQNVSYYLYLALVRVPLLWVRARALQFRLYLSLRWNLYLMRKGITPQRFYDMASEIRNDPDRA